MNKREEERHDALALARQRTERCYMPELPMVPFQEVMRRADDQTITPRGVGVNTDGRGLSVHQECPALVRLRRGHHRPAHRNHLHCDVHPTLVRSVTPYPAGQASQFLPGYETLSCDNSPGSIRGLLGRSQGLLPQSQQCSSEPQDIPRGVAITVEDQPTAGVEAISEGQCLPMSTAKAVLRRLRGVHREKAPTGPGCLVGDVRCELGPRRSMDARGETGGMPHPA